VLKREPTVVFYVSGHGYGHATRCRALIRALKPAVPSLKVVVRSEAPARLFEEAGPGIKVSRARIDVGMLQPNGLDIDLKRTLKAHQAFVAGWDKLVDREAAFIKKAGAQLVVGDIPPLAFAAAATAKVPSVAFANFSWDWILDSYAADDARWKPVVRHYRKAYAFARELLRLPMHGDFPAFKRIQDIPLAVNRSGLSRATARTRLGLELHDDRPCVLVSFGGFGSGPLNMPQADDLSDYVFVGFSAKPPGFRADWIEFPQNPPAPHVDLLAGCDILIGKPGYGTFSEAVAHRKRMLYLPREGFPEVPRLLAWMKYEGLGRELSRRDFSAGRWRAGLDELMAAKADWPPVKFDGAEVAAARLVEQMTAFRMLKYGAWEPTSSAPRSSL
jgi:UDP:flavonoid glycosyltransferase YjiC (YdhE family)